MKRHQAEAISMRSVEEGAWFYLTAYSKMQKERNKSRMELLKERNQNLKIWKFLSLSILQKKWESSVWKRTPCVWLTDHLVRKSVWMWTTDLTISPAGTPSLNWRGWKDCWTSWILQDPVRAKLFFKTREGWPWGQFKDLGCLHVSKGHHNSQSSPKALTTTR